MKTILITGGAGFIGSATVRAFIASSDARIVNVDKLTYAGNLQSLTDVSGLPRYSFELADICDGPALERVFAQYRPNGVVHLAAESHVDRSIDGPRDFLRTNVMGTGELLDVALSYWRELPQPRARGISLLARFHRRGLWRSRLKRARYSLNRRLMRRALRMQPRKRDPTTSSEPGAARTACRC